MGSSSTLPITMKTSSSGAISLWPSPNFDRHCIEPLIHIYFISYSRTTKSFKGWINQTCNIYHIPWALHTWLLFPNSNTKASASSQPSSASSSLPTFSCTLLPTQLPRSIQVSPPITCPWVGTCRCGISRYRNRYLLLRPECRHLYVSVICVADAILKICDIQPRYEKYTKKENYREVSNTLSSTHTFSIVRYIDCNKFNTQKLF